MRDIVIYIGSMRFPDKTAGVQRAFSLSKSIREIGYKAVLIGLDDNLSTKTSILDSKKEYEGFDCYCLPYPQSLYQWAYHMHTIQEFITVIENYGLENIKAIITMEYEALALWKLSTYCRKHSIKLIADAEEWYENSKLPFPMNIAKNFDTNLRMYYVYPKKIRNMICISRFFVEYYKDKMDKIVHIPGTIDNQAYKWNNLPNYFPNDIFTLGYAGSPGIKMDKERIDWLVHAICILNKQGKACRLLIAGFDKDIIEKYAPDIKEYPTYKSNIVFYGVITHKQSLDMIAVCDFSVIVREDKRVTKAGFPTKLSESFGCGTPVITTPSSNVADYIKDGENGFVTDSFDLDSLKSTIETAMSLNYEQLVEMHTITKNENPLTYDKFNDALRELI